MERNELLDVVLSHRAHVLAVRESGLRMHPVKIVRAGELSLSDGWAKTWICTGICLKCQAFWDAVREVGFELHYKAPKNSIRA